MTRFLAYSAIVIGLGATATLAISPRAVESATTAEARLAADRAFRDGLYLGKLAAEQGQPASAAVGRWSTEHDRSMFIAGYLRGYNYSLTSTIAETTHSTDEATPHG